MRKVQTLSIVLAFTVVTVIAIIADDSDKIAVESLGNDVRMSVTHLDLCPPLEIGRNIVAPDPAKDRITIALSVQDGVRGSRQGKDSGEALLKIRGKIVRVNYERIRKTEKICVAKISRCLAQ